MILTIAGSKGGPGKTTVARALAAELAGAGVDLVAVDADPTRALHRWVHDHYEGPPLPCRAEAREHELALLLPQLDDRHDLVLVDTAGFASQASLIAIGSADAVLVPCRASEPDLYEAQVTVLRVKALGASIRRPIGCAVLLNGVRDTNVARHVADDLRGMALPRLQTTLGLRQAYEAASFSGRLPKTGAAWREIDKLVDELRDLAFLPPIRQEA